MPRGVVEVAEEKPIAGVLMGMNAVSILFILTALAAGISWVVFVAKANHENQLGTDPANLLATVEVTFQAAVVSILLYFVARHHFSHMHY